MSNVIYFKKIKDNFELCENRSIEEQADFLLAKGETPYTIAKNQMIEILTLHQKGRVSYEYVTAKMSHYLDILARYHDESLPNYKKA